MGYLMSCYWCIQTAIGAFLWVAFYYFCKKGIALLEKKVCKKAGLHHKEWNKIFFPAIKILFFFVTLCFILTQIGIHFGLESFFNTLIPVRNAIVVVLLFWMIYRAKDVFIQKIPARGGGVIGKMLSVFILLLLILVVLRIFRVDIVPLLAFGGISAAAIGFAAKDIMSSFFGGIVLVANRSFSVGDQILIPEKNLEGWIEEIGWNVTRVRSKDRCAVYLPNTLFSQLLIINQSQRTGRRILETFPIRHADLDKMNDITQAVRHMLSSNRHIDKTFPVLVFFHAVNKHSLDFTIDVYTMATALADYVMIKDEVLGKIADLITQSGAQIARSMAVIEEKEDTTL
jgi:MscS family membrane protein